PCFRTPLPKPTRLPQQFAGVSSSEHIDHSPINVDDGAGVHDSIQDFRMLLQIRANVSYSLILHLLEKIGAIPRIQLRQGNRRMLKQLTVTLLILSKHVLGVLCLFEQHSITILVDSQLPDCPDLLRYIDKSDETQLAIAERFPAAQSDGGVNQ